MQIMLRDRIPRTSHHVINRMSVHMSGKPGTAVSLANRTEEVLYEAGEAGLSMMYIIRSARRIKGMRLGPLVLHGIEEVVNLVG